MPKNLIEKIWDDHVVFSKKGHPDVFAIDLHLIHEVTSPQAFSVLKQRGLPVHASGRCVATVDHNISTAPNPKLAGTPESRIQMDRLRANTADFHIPLLDSGSGFQGIVHVIGPELGLTQPGMTVACGDSHTSTHGAFGAIAFGIGTTEVSHVMATGCLLQQRPKTMLVRFSGIPGKGVTAKDLILKLIHQIGVGGGTGHILEYAGEPIRVLSMEERMTLCNMSIECGARAGLIAPDAATYAYLRGRRCAPQGSDWDRALAYWQTLPSDPGASYDRVEEVQIGGMAPRVTWGTNPAQSVEIGEPIPDPADFPPDVRESMEAALRYTQLRPGQRLEGVPVELVFIGSCTNARLSDLAAAAAVLKGRRVAPGVRVLVVPGSEAVRRAALEAGLDRVFTEAGAEFRSPGCSMCLAMNEDRVPAGKRCASTSNRNFIGRQGEGSITHLMSPVMAAASALEGRIADARQYL